MQRNIGMLTRLMAWRRIARRAVVRGRRAWPDDAARLVEGSEAPGLSPSALPRGMARREGVPARAIGVGAGGAIGAGAVAAVGLAVGAMTIGALAIGALAVGRARVRRLDIGDLAVGNLWVDRLHVREVVVEGEEGEKPA